MEREFKYFWVEFMISCLPEDVQNYYNDSLNQKRANFQSFKKGNTFWVRNKVWKISGRFELYVFDNEWIHLPYALHQEWGTSEYDKEGEENIDYFQIGKYRVRRNTIWVGSNINIGDQVWDVDSYGMGIYRFSTR